MSGPRPVIGVLATLVVIALAVGVLHARERHSPLPISTERLLYLRSGGTADRLFLSFDALAADVYWIRSIQHYGRDRRRPGMAGQFELLQPLLDLTTTLDPHFNVAYRFGAIFLSIGPPEGPGRTDQGIALLEKGLARNPGRWQYAHDIGFIHYWHTGNYAAAAEWFDRATAMPGAPEWLGPLAATTRIQGGDRDGARQLLVELSASPERYIRESAERALAQLQALDVIDLLEGLIADVERETGRYPTGWNDLVRLGRLPAVPADPTGEPYAYDPVTHEVALSPVSSLNPLPSALQAP